jgi:hypothetical protein
VTFTEPAERARAFAVYGGIAGSGGAAGLLLGGELTQYLAWRWCLYVNVPIAVIAVAGGWVAPPDLRPAGRPRLDVPGVLLATGSLAAVVDACTQAGVPRLGCAHSGRPLRGGHGRAGAVRGAGVPLGRPAAAAAHRGRPQPRWRVPGGGPCGRRHVRHVPALTYYFQVVLRFSPVRAGLAFLPMTAAVVASSAGIASPLLPRVPPRALIAPGLLVATAGLVWLTQLHPDSAYATHALPAEILTGLGIGCVFVPVFSLATQGVAPHETGIASAMVNTANQVGGSIGTALLNTIAASATAGYLAAHARGSATAAAAQGLVHGYTVAIAWGAGILAAAALLATIMITAGRPPHPGDNARPTAAHALSRQPAPARHPEAGGSVKRTV